MGMLLLTILANERCVTRHEPIVTHVYAYYLHFTHFYYVFVLFSLIIICIKIKKRNGTILWFEGNVYLLYIVIPIME